MLQTSLKTARRGYFELHIDESLLTSLEQSFCPPAVSKPSPINVIAPPPTLDIPQSRPSFNRAPTTGYNSNPLYQNRRNPLQTRTSMHNMNQETQRGNNNNSPADYSRNNGPKQSSPRFKKSPSHFNSNKDNVPLAVDTNLQHSSSGDAVAFKEVYSVPTNVKYLPVDMVTTPAVKKSIARNLLYSALKGGMTVIKHGKNIELVVKFF